MMKKRKAISFCLSNGGENKTGGKAGVKVRISK